MDEPFPDLVSTRWLADRLHDPAVVAVDASLHLPRAERDARADYADEHIPQARFLDLESLIDHASEVPRALPRPDQLATRLSELGVAPDTAVVVYDDSAIRSSARAWFMLKASGWPKVAILDGGLAKWRREGRPLESGIPRHDTAPAATLHQNQRVATKADVLENGVSGQQQMLDARSADRVFGTGEDPVHGGANGRIPGSFNLPYSHVFAPNGTYRPFAELRAAFERAGIDWSQPVITTCGSGITASVLLFAAHLAGKDDVRLYDGSWMEWSADPATPKAHGPEAQEPS